MITHLFIKNYALIDELEIDFDKGFTIITGETGSGKSIILGSLHLIMGQRSDTSVIADKNKKCVVEAEFDIRKYDLKPLFEKNDLDYFDKTIIRREISPEGRSRAFINDIPVNLQILKEISAFLIDIHSQHDTLLLNSQDFQMQVIDAAAGNENLLKKYKQEFEKYKKLQKQFNELTEKAKQQKADYDYFQFQYDQLENAKLSENELNELEAEQKQLSHTEEIKQNLSKITFLLNSDDVSVISMLKEALLSAENIADYFSKATEISERLQSVIIELQDLASETEVLDTDLELDPNRLEYINERLDTIYSLMQKFSVSTVNELLQLKDEFEQKLLQINSYDEQIEDLQIKLNQAKETLRKLSEQLSNKRKSAKRKLEKDIENLTAVLGMPNAKFSVEIADMQEFTATGTNKITFLFSANKNMPLQSVSKVASGGELSRLMLAVKYVVSMSKTLPTIIFDEIDTGISGEIADKTGELLRKMSENIQIINITHLPQIAAKGHSHHLVFKDDTGEKTVTRIKKLTEKERIEEIAKMLSGSKITETALQNAKELLLAQK